MKDHISHLPLSARLESMPNHLLNVVIDKLQLKNDAELARALKASPPLISKIRHRKQPVGSALLVRMLEATDLSIRQLYELSTE